jgi:hypothetical protein
MKHTSIRLSEEHAARITETRKSPTVIIKAALDLYFNMPSDNIEAARALMDEHIRIYHKHKDEHKVSTIKPVSESVPHDEAHNEHNDVLTVAHNVSTEARTALLFILAELEAGREPTVNEVAEKVGLTTTGLGMALSKCGIKAKNTHRDMQTVRIYTKPMKATIEKVLETTK